MEVWQSIATGVVIFLGVALLVWWIYERNRTHHLRERFGPEYERRIASAGNRRRAESELAHSEERVERLKDHPLAPSDQTRFTEEWRLCQARFVDDPGGAVNEADRILTDIMRAHGYAVDDPFDRVADLSAAYPHHAPAYREASDIVVSHRQGKASTEDL